MAVTVIAATATDSNSPTPPATLPEAMAPMQMITTKAALDTTPAWPDRFPA